MDIYQALTKDHNEIKPLLQQLVDASEVNQDTKVILKRIEALLIPHARAEEAVLYNSIRDNAEGSGKAMHGYVEHLEAETLLRTLQGMSAVGVEWTAAARKLQNGILHHIEEEETEIFEVARRVLSYEEAQQMGAAFERLKPQIDEGVVASTMDLVANVMPQRFVEKFRQFTFPKGTNA